MSEKNKPFVNLSNAREAEQIRVMEEIQKQGVCPFCPANLATYHKKPILWEGLFWILTENQWPYDNTRVHLLAIHREHAETLAEIVPLAWSDLGTLLKWAERRYGVQGGAIGMRFGNPEFNGGTVRHLHLQFLTAAITDQHDPAYKPVRLRVG